MKIELTKRYLCFPIRCGATESKTRFILPEYQAIVSLELCADRPDFYVYFDALYHQGGSVEILHEDGAEKLRAQDLYVLSDAPMGDVPLFEEPNRPLYHFTNARGWINDPNGMVKRNGEYHMFYQLNSFGSRWYDKGWGHAKSANLYDWEILPPGLFADDSGYAISGSALFDEENRAGFGKGAWILAYSTRKGDRRELGQTIDIAYSLDGEVFHKYEGNPVLTDASTPHFRDPKVFWHEPTHRFVMVMAAGYELRFYNSIDLKSWTLTGVLDNETIDYKGMIYECPEMMEYPVQGSEGARWVLQVSILHKVLHIVGDFDGLVFTRDPSVPVQWADYGKDFYAAVGYNPDGEMQGRHVWIGWMADWRYTHFAPKLEGWMGIFTVPRELTLRKHADGGLYVHQLPAGEIAQLTSAPRTIPKQIELLAGGRHEIGRGIAYDVSFTVSVPPEGQCGLTLAYDSGEQLVVSIDGVRGELTVNRAGCSLPELGELFLEPLTMPLPAGGPLVLRMLADKGSIELYLQDGQNCLAALCYPKRHEHVLELWNDSSAPVAVRDVSLCDIRRAHWKV